MELADWEQFRGDAHALVDWIIDYRKNLEKYPVVPSVGPNDIYNSLPADPPSEPETFEAVLKDVNEKIMPGITHWQSPNFFAFFPSNSAPSGLLADLLSGGLGVQGMIWQTSPACTEVETLMLDWLAKIIDLPAKFFSNTQKGGGVIQGTASEALLVCLLAARDRVLAGLTLPEGHEQVPTNDKIAVYCSDQTHSSCKKAVMISGIPVANLRAISTAHSKGSLLAKDFIATVEADRLQGLFPSFCCLTVGTTGVGATDEIKEIARYCRENNIWCHIDGAYAGSACICPEYRELIAGVEDCNSFNFNPHKWLLANFDCSCLWIDDRKDILRALSITPEYLRNAASESGAVIDYRDWQIPLGRRFRALKLWFMLRLTGVEKLRTMIRSHVSFAAQFEELVKNDDRFEVPFPRSLGLVTFRLKGDNEINAKLLAAVNLSKQFYLVHTVFDGLYVIRMAIGAYSTQIDHVLACWAHIKSCTDALLSSPSSLSSSE